MSVPALLRKVMDKFQLNTEEETYTSMVLLLRKQHFFTKSELERAAEKAWNRSFTNSGEKSRHCVVQSGHVTMMKVGPHVLNMLHVARPYFEEMDETTFKEFLPEPERQLAWGQHCAWVAIDYLNEKTDEETKYCVLAKFVAELLDTNCAGVWIPKISGFAVNTASLYSDFQTLASSKEIDLN